MAVIITPGDTNPSDVRVNKRFNAGANYNAVGTMYEIGTINKSLAINETYIIPEGHTDGGQVTQSGISAILGNYVIATGETIAAGDVVEFVNNQAKKSVNIGTSIVFESASIDYISATVIDSSRVLVAYRDVGNSYYGTAIVLTIFGTAIVAGTPFVFASAMTNYISATTIDRNKILVAYQNGSNYYGKSIVLTISDTTITAGTVFDFATTNTTSILVTTLDSSKVLVIYKNNSYSYRGTAIVLTISGTTITAGTSLIYETSEAGNASITSLDNNKVLVAYEDGNNSSYGTAIVLTISDTTITAGTPLVFENGRANTISLVTIDNTKALAVYGEGNSNYYGKSIVLTISDTTITAGTPLVFENAQVGWFSATSLVNSKVLVTYRYNTGGYGKSIVLTVSGSTITAGTAFVFESNTVLYLSAKTLDSNRVLVAYSSTSNYGTAKIVVGEKVAHGVAIESGTAGQTKQFYDWRV